MAAILNEMSPYILLGFLIAGLLHVFVSPAAMSRHLSGSGWRPVVKAALLGVPLPLCSCGVLPAAISLRRSGASRGATTSFLIATPQTGVDSIAATWSLLGLPMAIMRPVAALIGSVAGGMAVDRFTQTEAPACCDTAESGHEHEHRGSFFKKIGEAVRYGFVDMVDSVGKWLVIGLIVAALITVFVPESLFTSLSQYPLLAMLAVVAVAIPMYICATGSIPIALSLMMKGLSPGIAFVMLMAGPAANFASVLLLSRTQGRRATAIYVGSVVVTAIAFGLLIDCVLPTEWFVPDMSALHHTHGAHGGFGLFSTLCSALLVGLLAYSAIKVQYLAKINDKIYTNMESRKYQVKGMNCGHCKASVEKAVSAVAGVESVVADLGSGTALVVGDADPAAVRRAIELAGFEAGE